MYGALVVFHKNRRKTFKNIGAVYYDGGFCNGGGSGSNSGCCNDDEREVALKTPGDVRY